MLHDSIDVNLLSQKEIERIRDSQLHYRIYLDCKLVHHTRQANPVSIVCQRFLALQTAVSTRASMSSFSEIIQNTSGGPSQTPF
jgi:hypothetical protein